MLARQFTCELLSMFVCMLFCCTGLCWNITKPLLPKSNTTEFILARCVFSESITVDIGLTDSSLLSAAAILLDCLTAVLLLEELNSNISTFFLVNKIKGTLTSQTCQLIFEQHTTQCVVGSTTVKPIPRVALEASE